MTAVATQQLSLIANRGDLAECLAAVAIAAKRGPRPVLECVHLLAADGALELRCTDLETQLRRITRQVQVSGEGQACVKAADLLAWLKLADDETVEIVIDNDKLTVKSSNSGLRSFYTLPASDFPPVPHDEGGAVTTVTMPADSLRAAHGFVAHAARKQFSRYATNGVLFERDKKRLGVVATDGRRVAVTGIDAAAEGDVKSAIIPGEYLSAAIRSLPEDEGADVEIRISGNNVAIQSGDATAWSLLIEGSFPPWRDVIPSDATTSATVDRESFLAAVRRAASVMVEEKTGLVRFKFTKSGIAMSAASAESGAANVTYPCKVTGNDLEIGFNARFIADALAGMVGETVEFALKAPNLPGKLTCGPMTEVIMPINLNINLNV